jgi:hypothetical protein
MAKPKKESFEPVYDKGEEPSAELIAALESAETSDMATFQGMPVMRTANVIREAAILTLTHGADRVLYVRPRILSSLSPNRLMAWQALARLSEETMGSHKFLVGRRYRAPTTDQAFAALEHVYGRTMGTNLEGAFCPERQTVEITNVDREAFVTLRSKALVLYVKWGGLWWAATRYSGFEPRRAEDVEREARSAALVRVNHRPVAIV